MAVLKSDQITKLTAQPAERLPPDEAYGRQRTFYFNEVVPAGNAAIADTIQLCDVPAGMRIVGGHATWEAMTTGAGAATIELGDGTAAAKYLEATSVDAAGSTGFADTIARNYSEKLTSKLTLTATVSVEAWAAGQRLTGHVKAVLD